MVSTCALWNPPLLSSFPCAALLVTDETLIVLATTLHAARDNSPHANVMVSTESSRGVIIKCAETRRRAAGRCRSSSWLLSFCGSWPQDAFRLPLSQSHVLPRCLGIHLLRTTPDFQRTRDVDSSLAHAEEHGVRQRLRLVSWRRARAPWRQQSHRRRDEVSTHKNDSVRLLSFLQCTKTLQ